MESYIIRIYRREKDDLQKIAGVAEIAGIEGMKRFNSLDELLNILLSEKKINTVRKKRGEESKKYE